jgi:hypothetical protein
MAIRVKEVNPNLINKVEALLEESQGTKAQEFIV